MRAATVLGLLSIALALAGAAFMLFGPSVREVSCQATPGGTPGRSECTESSASLLDSEDDARIIALAAVPLILTAGTTFLTFQAPRPKAPRWLLAGVYLFLCLLTGFTIGIFFLPSALLLIASVATDQTGARDGARVSG